MKVISLAGVAIASALTAGLPTSPLPWAQSTSVHAAPNTTSEILALDALEDLPVKGRASRTGYSRAQFGAAWADVDRNRCDTRNDILRRDLKVKAVASNGCTVLTGMASDPYTGADLIFVRGSGTSSSGQIDHVVSIAPTRIGT